MTAQRLLAIGGPRDGTLLSIERGEDAVVIETSALVKVYRRERIAVGGKVFEVLVHDRITLAEAVLMLLDRYLKPRAKALSAAAQASRELVKLSRG